MRIPRTDDRYSRRTGPWESPHFLVRYAGRGRGRGHEVGFMSVCERRYGLLVQVGYGPRDV